MGYWYWVVLVLGDIWMLLKIGIDIGYCQGLFAKLVLVLGIVKALLQHWYWYWVWLGPFQNIGISIGYC